MKRLAFFGALYVSLALAGCGGDATTATTSSSPSSPRVTEVPGPGSKKLKIRIPSGPPPKELVVRDLRKGTGPAVEGLKDEIIVNYVGIDYATGKAFYDSWDQGGPSKFLLEETHKGWEVGLKGMRAGGLRELITPPRFEYGTTTFIYVIEMAKIHQAGQTRFD